MTSEKKTVITFSEEDVKEALVAFALSKQQDNTKIKNAQASVVIRTRTTGYGMAESDERYVEGSVTLVH